MAQSLASRRGASYTWDIDFPAVFRSSGSTSVAKLCVPSLFCLAWLAIAAGSPAVQAAALDAALAELDGALVPGSAGFQQVSLAALDRAALAVESAAAQATLATEARPGAEVLATTERFLAAKLRVDRALDQALAKSSDVAKAALALPEPPRSREMLRNYLHVTSRLIDLSGRLRYLTFDVVRTAAGELADFPSQRSQLLELLLRYRCAVGAAMLVEALFEPASSDRFSGPGPSLQERSRLLELIAVTGQTEQLPELARFINSPGTDPRLLVQAAETIKRIGLPQEVRPGQDPTLPPPAITPKQLRTALGRLPAAALDKAWQDRRLAVLNWLDARITHGVPADKSLMIGPCAVRPGDWLLMRNPSPYNLFTDLSPGLFTHVGVIAWEKGSDSLGRMVLVDLPERGTTIPATNIDTFVKRTRHYVILRHKDPEIAKKMGESATSMIGNPSQFDMNFRTDRVLRLAGQPLAGQTIHTYCAGLLLLCALQTDAPRESFFPVTETHAGGLSAENLATLGMSFGEDFISPTGALFSSQMQIAGRCEPNYDPQREVEEAIYDYFATRLMTQRLHVSPDLYQTLRLKVANAAKKNALLAQAFAQAAGVSPDMDLVSAAKAVAVVETLDEVAYGSSGQFTKSLEALKAGPIEGPLRRSRQSDVADNILRYRQQHAGLFDLWQQGRLSPRALRIELVKYYIAQGKRQIDQRFFSPTGKALAK